MWKLKLKSVVALIIVLSFGAQVYAGKQTQYKTEYHKNYDVVENVQVNVVNKYGLVKIISGPVNEVSIDVTVSLAAKNQEQASKLLGSIKIILEGSESEVSATTHIENNNKFKELSIEYVIHMPINGSIDVENKFGDFYLNELKGNVKLLVAYGKVDIGTLHAKQNEVTVKFGEAKINYATYLTMVGRYSKVHVDQAKLFNIDSQYGEVKARQIGRLILASAYDEVNLGTIVEMDASIMKEFKLDAQYSDVDIAFVSKDFTDIEIHASFGDVAVAFESGSNFEFDGQASYGDINIPSGTVSTVQKNAGSDSYEGAFFEGKKIGHFKARLSYGDLDVSIF